jgi:CubicO group peptidase (beta-lactamase class C family)
MRVFAVVQRLALLFLCIACARSIRADLKGDVDAFARKAMQQIGTTPGLAVAIVKDGAVVYRGEFGLRDVRGGLPVTQETRFFMASTTKAVLAMTAAILAEEERVDLDAPIGTIWPELELTPPLDPRRVSLRDLLAMRSGVGSDTLNFRMEIDNVDEAELLRLLKMYSREEPRTFRYSNASYVLAGRVVEKVAGKPWFEAVREKTLLPLGMTSTVAHPAPAGTVVAKAYRQDGQGGFVETPVQIPAFAGPAGGLLTTTEDAARWVAAMLNGGRTGTTQALPRRSVRMVQSAQTTNKRRFRYFDRFAWGLGEDLALYEGELLVHRFGGVDGAYSHVSFMPDRNIGVVAFANGGGAVPDAVAAYAYDRLLGKPGVDAKWSAELTRVAGEVAGARERRRKALADLESSRREPARPIALYAAVYHYDRLGDLALTLEEARLYARFGNRRAEMIPTGGEAFAVDWLGEGEPSAMKFVVDESGLPVRLEWGNRVFERVR